MTSIIIRKNLLNLQEHTISQINRIMMNHYAHEIVLINPVYNGNKEDKEPIYYIVDLLEGSINYFKGGEEIYIGQMIEVNLNILIDILTAIEAKEFNILNRRYLRA